MSYDGEGHAYNCTCSQCSGLDEARTSLRNAQVREAQLLHAVMHVVRYGKLGKQSKARLKAVLRANARGRTS